MYHTFSTHTTHSIVCVMRAGIAEFLLPLVYAGHVNRITWVKPHWAKQVRHDDPLCDRSSALLLRPTRSIQAHGTLSTMPAMTSRCQYKPCHSHQSASTAIRVRVTDGARVTRASE